jgi:hypothetical protein
MPYIDALGVETAVRFFLHFGGAELYIPRAPKGKSELVEELGMEAALALSALAERMVLPPRIPTAKPWLARYMKVVEGYSVAKISRKLHSSDVAVRRWIAGMGDHRDEASNQLSLF